MKRLLALLVILITLLSILLLGGGYRGLAYFIDIPSLLLIAFILFPTLILSDQLKDYLRGFSFLMVQGEMTTKEIEVSLNAMDLAIKTVYFSGGFGALAGLVMILGSLNDPTSFGPALAVAILTFFYAVIINLFQYAVKSRLKKESIYRS